MVNSIFIAVVISISIENILLFSFKKEGLFGRTKPKFWSKSLPGYNK